MNITKNAVWLLSVALMLAGCGGSNSSPGQTTPTTPTTLTLFVSGEQSSQIYVFNNASATNGNVAPNQRIVGAATNLQEPCDIAYDSTRQIIYTANWSGASVVSFENSTSPTGNVASSRVIAGAATGFVNNCGVEVDAPNNRLYVGGNHGIAIYDAASTVNGNVAPHRLVTGAATLLSGGGELRLFLDQTNDRLYAADPGNSHVLVFNNASTMDGNVPPSRVISGANTTFSYPWGISVDLARNTLYISDSTASTIFVFDNAGTVAGNIAPSRMVSGASTGLNADVTEVFIDTIMDTLYVVLRSTHEIRAWGSASTMNGNVAPSRVISGLNTSLDGPNGIVGVYR